MDNAQRSAPFKAVRIHDIHVHVRLMHPACLDQALCQQQRSEVHTPGKLLPPQEHDILTDAKIVLSMRKFLKSLVTGEGVNLFEFFQIEF